MFGRERSWPWVALAILMIGVLMPPLALQFFPTSSEYRIQWGQSTIRIKVMDDFALRGGSYSKIFVMGGTWTGWRDIRIGYLQLFVSSGINGISIDL